MWAWEGPVRFRRGWCLWLIAGWLAGVATPALALGGNRVEVDIQAQDLALALIQFARQAGVEIAFTQQAVKTKKAPRVRGRFQAAEALAMLLADSGLAARETAEGVFLIEGRRPEAPPATEAVDHGPQPYDVMEEISVSGTRIQRSGMTTPTPVTSMTTEELHQLSPTTLMDALSQLPQFSGNQTPATVNTWTGNSGGAILNLRGVGGNRTLTLLNGRRIVSSTRIGTTDVNIFPEAVMQRVEVVTGGASAAYGSDAVAGVVNFILDTDFEGVKGAAQGGISQRGDAGNYKLSLALGSAVGERGHVLISGDYNRSSALKTYRHRDWFDNWGVIDNPDPDGPDRIHARNLHSRAYTAGGLVTTGPFAWIQFLDDGTPAPFLDGGIVSDKVQSGGSGYDMSSRYWPTTENTRGSLFGYASYDLNASWTVYVQGLYGHSNSTTDKGPNLMYGAWAGTIFLDNAYLPESLRQQMVDAGVDSVSFNRAGSRDLGGALASMDNDTYSITTGFEGEVSGWRVNGYYQYGINKQRIDLTNVVRLDRIYRSLDAVRDPMGRIVCRSTLLNPNDGCVPTSFFGDGAVTAEARDYILDDERVIQDVDQHFAEVTVDGEPIQGWAGPISMALGASIRRDGFFQLGDPSGIGTGQAGCLTGAEADMLGYKGLPSAYQGCTGRFERGSVAEVSGNFTVKELFAETLVPLIEGLPLARAANLSLAARYADYSGSGSVWAWKAGLDWKPIDDLRLRGTISRDTRAGTLSERFDTSTGGVSAQDPFLPGGPTYPFTQVSGGDPTINPEKANTYVLGAVYQPSWLDGFALSVDYYDVQIKGAISTLGVQRTIDECYANQVQFLCDRIERAAPGAGQAVGPIIQVQNTYLNIDEARARGIDIEASYRTRIAFLGGTETLALRALFSHIIENSTTVKGVYTDTAGQTGVGEGRPGWQGTTSINYYNGPWTLFLQERYLSAGTYDARWTTGVDIDDNSVAAAFYTNLGLVYDFGGGEKEWAAFLNVTNLFDKAPPLAPTYGDFFGSSHTNQGLFDEIGRRITLGLNFRY